MKRITTRITPEQRLPGEQRPAGRTRRRARRRARRRIGWPGPLRADRREHRQRGRARRTIHSAAPRACGRRRSRRPSRRREGGAGAAHCARLADARAADPTRRPRRRPRAGRRCRRRVVGPATSSTLPVVELVDTARARAGCGGSRAGASRRRCRSGTAAARGSTPCATGRWSGRRASGALSVVICDALGRRDVVLRWPSSMQLAQRLGEVEVELRRPPRASRRWCRAG